MISCDMHWGNHWYYTITYKRKKEKKTKLNSFIQSWLLLKIKIITSTTQCRLVEDFCMWLLISKCWKMCLTPVQSQEIFILTCIICFSENGELLWKKVDIGMLRWLDWIWTNSIWERFRSILKWSLKRHKNSKIACYPHN